MKKNYKFIWLAFIFLLSLFFSAVFLIFFSQLGPAEHLLPGTDYLNTYQPLANSLLAGKGLTIKGEKVFSVPPGYPFFLAMIFWLARQTGIGELQLIIIFNVIIAALSTCFLFLIGELIFERKIALLASFFWLSYPLGLWFLKNPNTEVPFILLLLIGIWFYLLSLKERKARLIFLAGIFLGLTSLVRPISFLLSLFLAPLVFLILKENSQRVKFSLAIILLAGNLLVIFPWEVYLVLGSGKVLPLSSSGPSALVDGLTFALKPGAGGDKIRVPQDVLALMDRARSEDLNTTTKIFKFLSQEFLNRPLTFLKLLGLKLVRSWYATSQKWWEKETLAIQLGYLLTAFLGIIYGLRKYQRKIGEIALLLAIIIYFWLMAVLALSILRYLIPAMSFLMIFSALTFGLVIEKFLRKFIFQP